ncbi:hypothetical protein LPAF129_04240 [Ligilactobacillus pabuli]|uniref:Uncharacterized protein n=1 Tax=Ligilactobacillus pabuli TaxID=2886039 RepID=A0ABQ5JFA7_9LACO|nr:hypothetical protein [Ligilactobacillus pabuli]GKS80739.1 hypothetical protein LPAF129_04240 [Ligilactobacillus pabuli]
MNIDPQLGAVIIAIISGLGGWYANKSKRVSSTETVYAEHTQDLWARLDKLSNELNSVTQERNQLQIQVEQLSAQIEDQSKMIGNLQLEVRKLTNRLESKNEET